MPSRTIQIRVSEERYQTWVALAARDERSVSNWITVMVQRQLSLLDPFKANEPPDVPDTRPAVERDQIPLPDTTPAPTKPRRAQRRRSPRNRPKITPTEIDAAQELRNQGVPVPRIAERFNVLTKTIYRYTTAPE